MSICALLFHWPNKLQWEVLFWYKTDIVISSKRYSRWHSWHNRSLGVNSKYSLYELVTLKRCHFAWNIVFGQPGFILPDFTSFEVGSALPKIVKRKYIVEYPINIVGKITSEIRVPWLCWTNQIYHSPFGLDINEWLIKWVCYAPYTLKNTLQ
jgi:hypothetical protein